MDTNFNAALYQEEMLSLVNTAIKKLKAEHPDYTVFTISLTTDFASGVSAVHFDSRASSDRQSEYGRDVCSHWRDPDYQSCGL